MLYRRENKEVLMSMVILSLLLLWPNSSCNCNPDSTWFKLELNLGGRWQQGNLSQFGIQPALRMQVGHTLYHVDLQSSYQLLQAGEFTLIDDFWTQGKLSWAKKRSIYPVIAMNYGYALSYRIDQSFLMGVGFGSELQQKNSRTSLQVNLFTGYLHFNFEGQSPSKSGVLGSLIELALPLGKSASFGWQAQSYHPLGNNNFWGINSAMQFNYTISKQFSLQTNYQFIFNNQTVMDIKKVNTLLLFGFRYQLFTPK